jgi:hypothetical protein
MTGTFNTPLGKIRVASLRRFILVRDYGHGPFIARRSDTRATLEREFRNGDFILDTAAPR